ncbi:MAG: tetratricopeptide repeat protein [Halobacteriovoraceae bacterium]|jgi:tetratricopeptide (TPR) repeat protein|nr:tetratricopeptide repeat protein [Halobacteriovoraceae bacterium]MBT5094439.1 tetratricopeptide repeat protein [Halobacteriovoraceae bacterium]
MNKLTALILLALLISACGTAKKNIESVSELDKIKNSDFNPKKQIAYNSRQDFYPSVVGLTTESIARLGSSRLLAYSNGSDSISKIASYCYQRNFNAAFEIVDAAYPTHKKNPAFWNQVGTCFFLQGLTKKALLYYNKSRDLNSRYAPPLNNLGVIYLLEDKEQKALLAFQKAAKVKRSGLIPQFNIAQIYLKYGFYRDSEKIFGKIYRKEPSDVDVINGLATCKLMRGNSKLALGFYRKLAKENYQRPDIGLNYSVALRMNGENEKAKQVFEQVDDSKLGKLKPYFFRVKEYVAK